MAQNEISRNIVLLCFQKWKSQEINPVEKGPNGIGNCLSFSFYNIKLLYIKDQQTVTWKCLVISVYNIISYSNFTQKQGMYLITQRIIPILKLMFIFVTYHTTSAFESDLEKMKN